MQEKIIKKTSPIGVFDSGIGGLTVLKQLIRILPYENYVYFGDTARVPYGNKSETTVKQYSEECTNFLLSKNVKLIVIACNTVSSVALQTVIKEAGNIPVIGMIVPAATAAVRATINGNIGVIGTRATIQSGAYSQTIKELANDKNVNVFSQECPLFVPLVEEGLIHHPATKMIADEYLNNLINENIDTLVLGCTHYPMLAQLIREIVPNEINQIDSGEFAAVSALRLLADKSLLQEEKNDNILKHNIKFYVTDYPNHFYSQSQNFLGFTIDSPEFVEL
jgi:glutamate racemase